MVISSDGGRVGITSLSGQLSPDDVNVDLTMCGLLVERTEELVALYQDHGNWNDVEQVWFDERRSNRSTRGSSRKLFRVLSGRLKNAPAELPNQRALPEIFDQCDTERDKAQVLYYYLVADDALVRYVVHEYAVRQARGRSDALDLSDDTLTGILSRLEFADGSSFEYAESTTRRWCEGLRSVMREVGVLESQQTTVGQPPSIGDTPLLVAIGYSYEDGGDEWVATPTGLSYLLQPEERWQELFDRAARTRGWEYVELHSDLQLRPTNGVYGELLGEGAN
jgi:hypothetical protein